MRYNRYTTRKKYYTGILGRYEEITGQSTLESDQNKCCHVLDALSNRPSVHWPLPPTPPRVVGHPCAHARTVPVNGYNAHPRARPSSLLPPPHRCDLPDVTNHPAGALLPPVSLAAVIFATVTVSASQGSRVRFRLSPGGFVQGQ
jgi:hypothetical protein